MIDGKRIESEVFLKDDIENILEGLKLANPGFRPAYDAFRRTVGLEINGPTTVADWPQSVAVEAKKWG